MTLSKGAGCTMVSAMVTAETVIDRSMTILNELSQKFGGRVDTMWGGAPLESVIDRSMPILEQPSEKCH